MPPALDDSPRRALRADEAAALKYARPGLLHLSHYLYGNSFTRTLAEARPYRCCVALHDPTADGRNPAYAGAPMLGVNIIWAAEWCRDNPLDEDTPPPKLDELEAALTFMNGREASTIRPAGEIGLHRIPGWWRIHAETHVRLMSRAYVPTLRTWPGRPPLTAKPGTSVSRLARHLTPVGVTEFTRLVRDYLAASIGPTPVMAVAYQENRPISVRQPGRPSRIDPYSAYLPNQVYIHAAGIAQHSQDVAERLGLAPMGTAQVELAFRTAAATDPVRFSQTRTMHTMDSPNAIRSGRRLLLVNVPALGHGITMDMEPGRMEYGLYRDWLDAELRAGRTDPAVRMRDFMRSMSDYRDSLTPRR